MKNNVVGILSMFAAKAGASLLIAVDQSDYQAMDIIQENGFDSVIEVIRGNTDDTAIHSDLSKFDIIILEWMGYFLLFEGIDTVLYCRDAVLQENGHIYPDWCSLSQGWISPYKFLVPCLSARVKFTNQ